MDGWLKHNSSQTHKKLAKHKNNTVHKFYFHTVHKSYCVMYKQSTSEIFTYATGILVMYCYFVGNNYNLHVAHPQRI